MPVASSKISRIEPYAQRVRVRYEVTLTDGRIIPYGPVKLPDQAAADAFLPGIEARALREAVISDSKAAVRQRIGGPFGEASADDIAGLYIQQAADSNDPSEVLSLLTPIQATLESSRTDEEIGQSGRVHTKTVTKARNRWTRLSTRIGIVTAYEAIGLDD